MTKGSERDEQVLIARRDGDSFAKIATKFGFEDSRAVLVAYQRAVGRHTAEEQVSIRAGERKRFDAMAENVRARNDLTATERKARLARIARLRATLGGTDEA